MGIRVLFSLRISSFLWRCFSFHITNTMAKQLSPHQSSSLNTSLVEFYLSSSPLTILDVPSSYTSFHMSFRPLHFFMHFHSSFCPLIMSFLMSFRQLVMSFHSSFCPLIVSFLTSFRQLVMSFHSSFYPIIMSFIMSFLMSFRQLVMSFHSTSSCTSNRISIRLSFHNLPHVFSSTQFPHVLPST